MNAADRQRTIEKVRRRVSALGDGSLDRGVLAKSILASRSLLERNGDIGRLLERLQVPFNTDERLLAAEDRDRTVKVSLNVKR